MIQVMLATVSCNAGWIVRALGVTEPTNAASSHEDGQFEPAAINPISVGE
jgi:hypothetical protein